MNLKKLTDNELQRQQDSIQGDMDDALSAEDFETHSRLMAILINMNAELASRGLLWTPDDKRIFGGSK